jgi:hypothetical protein
MSASDGTIGAATKILDNGPDTRRWTVVLVAEGYRAADQAKFAADCQQFVNQLVGTGPFDEMWRAINVYRLDVTSTDAGADDPATCPGGAGTTARTFFDATFCTGGVGRLLAGPVAPVQAAVTAKVSHWDQILVVVNTTKYGGSGGTTAFTSTHTAAGGWPVTAIHEIGHSAFHLADEYSFRAACTGETGRDHHPASEPSNANVTTDSAAATIKWRDLLDPAIPFPRVANPDCTKCDSATASTLPAGTVGAFEGANEYHCGAFRSEFTCMMRQHGRPFCQVCQRRILQSLAPRLFGGPETLRTTIDPGWTAVVPFELAGQPHYLRYSAVTGKMGIDRVRPAADGVDVVHSVNWTAGWTSLASFRLGGQPHLVLYKVADGSLKFERVKPTGAGTDNVHAATWQKGRTTFMPFELGGVPHLLAYKGGDGNVVFEKVKPTGAGTDNVFTGTFTPGRTAFVPFTLGGQPHYLSYNALSGAMTIERIRPGATGVDVLFSDTWSPGWTSFAPFQLASANYYLAYKALTGEMSIDRIRPSGRGVDTLFRDNWTAGWTSIVPFALGGIPRYLAYKAAGGDLSLDFY